MKNLKNYVLILFMCSLVVGFLCFFIKSDSVFLKIGNKFYDKSDFHKAAVCYESALNLQNFRAKYFKFFDKKTTEKDDLLAKIADCYDESGDVYGTLQFYKKILAQNKHVSVEDESFVSYIKVQIADSYSKLGYYNKALPIYQELKIWYPQNLIAACLNIGNYSAAKEILFSDHVRDMIEYGDDIDSAALQYLLLSYYLKTGQYNLILNYNVDDTFEKKLTYKVALANYYYHIGEYQKARDNYLELLYSPYLEHGSDLKMKLFFAKSANKAGFTSETVEIFKDVYEYQQKLYKYSPQNICTLYAEGQILNKPSKIKEAQKLFNALNLTEESVFKDKPDFFCEVNMNF